MLVELSLHVAYAMHCAIDIGVPREHHQGRVGSRGGVKDECLTVVLKRRVEISCRTDNGEASDMGDELKKQEGGQKR